MTSDFNLGMNRPISRREFVNGFSKAVGLASAGAALPPLALAEAEKSAGYPPGLTGMRGAHEGSYEVAHALARFGKRWPEATPKTDQYDLVVVGAGISGLAAARIYQQRLPKARILILDNHDDFGGHAKRNEFNVRGRTLIGYGGSQSMEEPGGYSNIALDLLSDLGVNPDRFKTAFDQGFYTRHGMNVGMFFESLGDKQHLLADFSVGNYSGDPLPKPSRKQIASLSLKPADADKLYELLVEPKNYLAEEPVNKRFEILWTTSYRTYLQKYCGVSEDLLKVFQQITDGTYGKAFDRVSAAGAWGYAELPGFDGLELDKAEFGGTGEAYIYHFPDGNASIARLLVRKLIPSVAPGRTMDDIVTARFDYSQLDRSEHQVQVRLNSTAVNVQPGGKDIPARVTYVRNGKTQTVTARHAILACNNGIIPSLIPELDNNQAQGLLYGVKTPLIYTNVALTHWRPFKKLGISELYCPDGFYSNIALDFPVSLGDYRFPQSPDEPIVLHMEHCPTNHGSEGSARDRFRLGRHQMLSMSFEDIERKTRKQLTQILGAAGFDPVTDIAAITVNRWPHGYAYGYSDLSDPEWEASEMPHIIGRRKIGNVSIANADAGAEAMMQAAIDQAYRAVSELL